MGYQPEFQLKWIWNCVCINIYLNNIFVWSVGESTTSHYCQKSTFLTSEKTLCWKCSTMLPNISLVLRILHINFLPFIFRLIWLEFKFIQICRQIGILIWSSIGNELWFFFIKEKTSRMDFYFCFQRNESHFARIYLPNPTSTSI